MKKKTLSIVIPVYNEENTVIELLNKVAAADLTVNKEIIIVNDGSTDSSPSLINDWQQNIKNTDAKIYIFNKKNGGKGSAVRLGIENSIGDVVIIQDADLEYDPNDYQKCIDPILNGETKIVYGSRALSENATRVMSSPSFFIGGVLLTNCINFLYGSSLTDEPTCYKCFDGNLIRNASFEGDKFDWEPEITSKLLRLGFEIKEVQISYFPRKINEGKKICWRDGLDGIITALKWRFASLKNEKQNLISKVPELTHFFKRNKKYNFLLYTILLMTIAVRLAVAIPGLTSDNPKKFFYRPDSLTYIEPAESILANLKYNINAISDQPATVRPPGYPLFLSGIFAVGGENNYLFSIICFSLISALTVLFIYKAARLMCNQKIAILAASLFAFNITSIAMSPMFLADTLFAFIITLFMYYYLRYFLTRQSQHLVPAFIFLAIATLVKPASFLLIPCAAIATLLIGQGDLKKKVLRAGIAFLIACCIIFPWLYRNNKLGCGWVIDTNTGNSFIHVTSAIYSIAEKSSGPSLRAKLTTSAEREFAANKDKYKNTKEREKYKIEFFKKAVKKHPFTFLSMYLNPAVLIPDGATFFELLNKTTGHKGTLEILNKKNIFAAAAHYFKGKEYLILVISPLLLIVLFTYICSALQLANWIFKWKWKYLLLFCTLSLYMIMIHAPVPMPRYHLGALPFLCIMGAAYFINLLKQIKDWRIIGRTVEIDLEVLKESTIEKERNIYIHPFFLARSIFWSRLKTAMLLINKLVHDDCRILDFGGGSGAFAKGLCNKFSKVDIIDLDASDAKCIKQHLKLDNLQIIEDDINNYKNENKYDVIVATDVLEHFPVTSVPVEFIKKNIETNGLLVVSLPTENYIYRLGRIVVNKKKPADHYFDSKTILQHLENNNFEILEKRFAPNFFLAKIPLFDIAVLRYKG